MSSPNFLDTLESPLGIGRLCTLALESKNEKCCILFFQHFYSIGKIDLFKEAVFGRTCVTRTTSSVEKQNEEFQVLQAAFIEFEKQAKESPDKEVVGRLIDEVITIKSLVHVVLEYYSDANNIKDLFSFKKDWV